MSEYTFRFAERCLYDYSLNCAKLERLSEELTKLYSTTTAKAQGYEPTEHNGEPGDPVAAKAMSIIALEDQIERLERKTEPIKNLLRALDVPFVLDGTPIEGLAKVARMYYFAKMPKDEIAARLGVTRQTVYNMRVRLVNLLVKYMELRIECQMGFDTLNENPCYTDNVE